MELEGGEYQLAVVDLTEALTIRAERGDALVLRASAYRKLNEPKAAIADLSEAIRLKPADASLYLARAGALMMSGTMRPPWPTPRRRSASMPTRSMPMRSAAISN